MSNNLLRLLGIIVLFITLYSCSASKVLYKKGVKLEEQGLYREALNYYYDALKRDNKNIDAIIALRNVGIKIYQEEMEKVSMYNKQQKYKEAIYTFLDGEKFRNKLNSVNVNIPKDNSTELLFDKSKQNYTKENLARVNNLIFNQKYKESEIILNELIKLNPKNQELQELRAMSYSEPIYREGLKNMENEQFRKAYFNFSKIENYRDSKNLEKLSQEKAKYVIAIIPLRNNTSRIEITDKLYGNIFKSIFDRKDPFLEVIDQNRVRNILNDQGIQVSNFNNNDPKFLEAMSQVFGVKAFLKGTITSAIYNNEPEKSEKKIGYEKYLVNIKDPKTKKLKSEIKYKKITYIEYKSSSKVVVSFNYSLVSETGKILITDIITKTKTSNINYAQYQGDYKNLVPSKDPTNIGVLSLRKKFTSNRNLKSIQELETEAVSDITKTLSNSLIKFNPENK